MFDFLENFSLVGILALIFSPILAPIIVLVSILAVILFIYYLIKSAFSEQKTKYASFSLERVKEVNKEDKNKK
jgi:uncharacterized membrane protein